MSQTTSTHMAESISTVAVNITSVTLQSFSGPFACRQDSGNWRTPHTVVVILKTVTRVAERHSLAYIGTRKKQEILGAHGYFYPSSTKP